MLAPLHHAIVRYEGASSLTTQRKALGEGEGEGEVEDAEEDQGETLTDGQRDPEASEGTSVTGGGGVCQEGGRSAGGGFYFSDGGQQTDFSAALRIRVGEGNREWPLTHVSRIFEQMSPVAATWVISCTSPSTIEHFYGELHHVPCAPMWLQRANVIIPDVQSNMGDLLDSRLFRVLSTKRSRFRWSMITVFLIALLFCIKAYIEG